MSSELASTFEAHGGRAHMLDKRMRSQLADSLEYLADEVRRQQPDSLAARRSSGWSAITDRLRMEGERIPPVLFSAYYRLVPALVEETDNLARALDDLELAAGRRPNDLYCRFGADTTTDGKRLQNLYLQALDTDPEYPFVFRAPPADTAQAAQASMERARELMRRCVPSLAQELDALIVEIVLASGADTPGAARFDGASSYQLWGALALNVDEAKSDLEMLETLAHEAGHCFLFGMTIDEPLVHNDDSERYVSPLRNDPRPMDGIYHATWVSARMHYAVRTARDSGLLSPGQLAESTALLEASRRAFMDGHAIVRKHGRLSTTGTTLMDGARRYMQSTA